MKNLFLNKFPSQLNNERGVAALVSIILAIIILGSVAFNFVAETRQKQSGSALTYTSTQALMIAEAGLRYAQKCMVDTAPGGETPVDWGCPGPIYDNDDWTTGFAIPSTIVPSTSFGGDGSFVVNAIADAGNDADNIKVTSIGTFRGAQRSLTRIVSRICTPAEPPDDGVDFCTSFQNQNNANVEPPLEDPPVITECDPDGLVNVPALDPNYDSGCACSPGFPCPDFDPNVHLLAGNWLDPSLTVSGLTVFCKFKIEDNETVKTKEDEHDQIVVIKDFTIEDNGELRLKDDTAADNAFTVTTATDRINVTSHPYAADDKVYLNSTDTLPAGLNSTTSYFVININANDFQLSLTASPGAAVGITDTGTGTHTVRKDAPTNITVYDDVTLKNNGVIRVKGTLAMLVADKIDLKNSSKFNQLQGNAANVLAMAENDVTIKNNAFFAGWIVSDAKLSLKNNAEVQGAISGDQIELKNNATVVFSGNEDAGGNATATVANECGTTIDPNWE